MMSYPSRPESFMAAPDYKTLPPLDPRVVILARATAHLLYAVAGALRAFGRALDEFAGS